MTSRTIRRGKGVEQYTQNTNMYSHTNTDTQRLSQTQSNAKKIIWFCQSEIIQALDIETNVVDHVVGIYFKGGYPRNESLSCAFGFGRPLSFSLFGCLNISDNMKFDIYCIDPQNCLINYLGVWKC